MSKRILLCDDEIHIIKAAEFKLSRAGYEVECAGDGEFGWQAIQRRKPDLLITDCQMPRLSGLGLIERIRTNPAYADLPIYMLTAKGFELSQSELMQKWNVLGIIAKPFSPREVLDLVNRTLNPELAETT
jgi:DNA-binding response OmpR family regulator